MELDLLHGSSATPIHQGIASFTKFTCALTLPGQTLLNVQFSHMENVIPILSFLPFRWLKRIMYLFSFSY